MMSAGSVIIDLAASSGGNCELSQNNKTIDFNGVKIIGQSSYPVLLPADASRMYGNNITSFLKLIIGSEDHLSLNWDDPIIKETCLTHKGEIMNTKIKQFYNS